MTKYRGRHDGKKEGNYIHIKISRKFKKDEYTSRWIACPFKGIDTEDNPFFLVDRYLQQLGVKVGGKVIKHDLSVSSDEKSASSWGMYHISGTTVKLYYHHFIYGDMDEEFDMSAWIDIDIFANRPVDDIITELKKKFPYLEEK